MLTPIGSFAAVPTVIKVTSARGNQGFGSSDHRAKGDNGSSPAPPEDAADTEYNSASETEDPTQSSVDDDDPKCGAMLAATRISNTTIHGEAFGRRRFGIARDE